ncbi:MAG: hypothetical protein J5I47_08210 [Vicingus serpentipes]|nr:hypothetical protein [Vicingus serpentipes]
MIKLNRVVVLMVVLFSVVAIEAQNTTNSPYSKYGIGILRPDGFTQSRAMGGIGVGLRSYKDINIINPAAHAALTITTFEVGVTNNALSLTDGTETQFKNNTYIDHLSFGIPIIMNKWGMGFGVLPYSSIGYKFEDVFDDPYAGAVTHRREGKGGVNKAYLTNAVQFNLDSNSLIAVGVNGFFYFGNSEHVTNTAFGDLQNGYNVLSVQEFSVADFGAEIGSQYQKSFKNEKNEQFKLILGVTYGMDRKLKSRYSEFISSYHSSTGEYADTISLIDDVRAITQLPGQYGVGISLQKNNKWTIGIDYRSSNWGAIASNSGVFKYNSNYSLAAGAEWIPKYDAFSNYLKRVAYRFGARYNTSYIMINDEDLTEYGITFGMGLPIRRQESAIPSLNFGFEYGKRGQSKNGLIEETFFNFSVGLTINDRWFIKRKYD